MIWQKKKKKYRIRRLGIQEVRSMVPILTRLGYASLRRCHLTKTRGDEGVSQVYRTLGKNFPDRGRSQGKGMLDLFQGIAMRPLWQGKSKNHSAATVMKFIKFHLVNTLFSIIYLFKMKVIIYCI